MRRYIIATEWEHIFSDGIKRTCPWVIDSQEEKLILLMILHERNFWSWGNGDAQRDLLDSLHHGGNEEFLEDPEGNGLMTSDSMPVWTYGDSDEPTQEAGSHAPDCPYIFAPGGECLCWRSDPEQNHDLDDDEEEDTDDEE
jgi:hypothetical protein